MNALQSLPTSYVARNRRAFSLVELLVVISIILMLAGIIVPSVGRAMEIAQRTRCTTNVRDIVRGITTFAQDPKQHRAADMPAGSLPTVHPRTTDWFRPTGNPACLWLLVEREFLSAAIFACPGAESNEGVGAPDLDDGAFREQTYSYSYLSMVEASGSDVAEKSTRTHLPATMIILADKNPRTRIDTKNWSGAEEDNSPNHNGEGQVVGRLSGQAQWVDKPNPDSEDNIYDAEPGGANSDGLRANLEDSMLIP